jgi:hypothetical protein
MNNYNTDYGQYLEELDRENIIIKTPAGKGKVINEVGDGTIVRIIENNKFKDQLLCFMTLKLIGMNMNKGVK